MCVPCLAKLLNTIILLKKIKKISRRRKCYTFYEYAHCYFILKHFYMFYKD